VPAYPDAPLYDPFTLRTLFLDFENDDWEQELADFNNTDVEVPATLTVDGRTLREVGVHFRGASSYFMVGEGRKRSLNLSLDFVHRDQQLGGYRTLNLLNSHGDPSYLRTVLYHHIATQYFPGPRANHVRVVINGESWGIYVHAQQFNKDLVRDWYGTAKGARWKVPGSPRGGGNLAYLGPEPEPYHRLYVLKTRDDEASWNALIALCRTLSTTPIEGLAAALEPGLDVDATLRFLALDNVLINNDGYWVRTSDYNLYRDESGRFHLLPHDANETFRPAGGPGFGGGPRGGGRGRADGLTLDPLAGADDPDKLLLHKLLAVPAWRERYLGYVRHFAETWLDWSRLGPLAEQYHALIANEVRRDTRQLFPFEAFALSLTGDAGESGGGGPGRNLSLKRFADERRAFLLDHPAVRAASPLELPPLPPHRERIRE
jgi:hypothetical protein